MKLKAILDAITAAETKVLPLVIHNPASQEIAGIAFLAEQTLFNFIESLHTKDAQSEAKN